MKFCSLLAAFALFFSLTAISQKDSLAFGDKNRINNGLEGKIYFLAQGTSKLPDLDTMRSQGTIYTKKINIPNQSWTNGFPGVTDRFEWFAIEYKGSFKMKRTGHYIFTLSSDDGSKLFIDGKLAIDNDGMHSNYAKTGEVDLDGSSHSITLQYFQGPRTEIALQLFYSLGNEEKKIFGSADDITLTTPGSESAFNLWWIALIAFVLIVFLIFFLRRKKKEEKK